MFARQKIKMEDSYHQLQSNLPYSSNQQSHYVAKYTKNPYNLKVTQPQMTNSKQNIKYSSFKTDYSEEQTKPNAARNEILKQLRQQYEILKNLSIDESVHVPVKKEELPYQKYEQKQSSLSSSVASKENKTYKQGNRQFQNLNLQKKQLQLVIGNSMRKIQELLSNEISLKKTIHQLKNQIQGRGGITMQYEKTIRNLQKNQEDLHAQLNKMKHQNQKNFQKIRQQFQRTRILETQFQKKERQLKQAFDEQRRLQQLLRIEKDKYMNLQIQCRSYKMEFQMLEKQKNNEINRLVREFQTKQGGNEKELSFIIKKLEDELRQKDKRYHDLLLQREKRNFRESEEVQFDKKGDKDKNYLQQIIYRSREINENNNKAFTDGMNMIFAKMTELQRKNDESLKKQIQTFKRKTGEMTNAKKSTESERQLFSKIAQLQKIIEREASEKSKMYENIKVLNEQKLVLQQKIRDSEKKGNEHYSRKQNALVQKISKELQQITLNYRAVEENYNNLKAEYVFLVQKQKESQQQQSEHNLILQNQNSMSREKQKRLEEQIRNLKRKIDQASFQAQKNKKQGDFNLTIYKTSQQSEAKRLISQNQRISQKLKQTEEKLSKIEKELQTLAKIKEKELTQHRSIIENQKNKLQQEILNQKKMYEEKIIQIDSKHSQQLKGFNQKFIAATANNQRLMVQLSHMGKLQSQVMQLRRLVKNNRSTSSGIDHLWQIKETQYGNIMHVLLNLQEEYRE